MKFFNKVLFFFVVIWSGTIYADCSYKVINHLSSSFEELRAVGTVGNLLIPRCTQNPSQDEETLENCATNANNTLYEHPHEASSCNSTKGKFINIQFSDREKLCKSIKPSLGESVILNYPEDFKCNFPL